MKSLIQKLFVGVTLLCLSVGSASAQLAVFYDPSVEMKAFLFDNDTGGDLTIKTKNVGIRVTALNNSQDVLQLNGVELGRLTLSSVKVPSQIVGMDPEISWPLILMNPNGNGNVVIGSSIGPVASLALPISRAQFQSNNTISSIISLKAGYYIANLSITAFNQRDGKTHIYRTIKEPVQVK